MVFYSQILCFLVIFLGFSSLFSSVFVQGSESEVASRVDLLMSRSNLTAFHTSATHKNFDEHLTFLDHQMHIFWPVVEDYISSLNISQKIAKHDQDRERYNANLAEGRPPMAPFTILDMGGANGALSVQLLRRFPSARVVCVDLDHNFLTRGANKYKEYIAADRLRFIHGSSSSMSLLINSVDWYISLFTWQHVYNIRETVIETHRVLAHGGIFTVIDADLRLGDLIYPTPPTQHLIEKMNELHIERHASNLGSGNLLLFLSELLDASRLNDVVVRPHMVSNRDKTKIITIDNADIKIDNNNNTDVKTADMNHTTTAVSDLFWSLVHPSQYFALVRNGLITEHLFNTAVLQFSQWREANKDRFKMVCFALGWSAQKTTLKEAKNSDLLLDKNNDVLLSQITSTSTSMAVDADHDATSIYHDLVAELIRKQDIPALKDYETSIHLGLEKQAIRDKRSFDAMFGDDESSDDNALAMLNENGEVEDEDDEDDSTLSDITAMLTENMNELLSTSEADETNEKTTESSVKTDVPAVQSETTVETQPNKDEL